MRKIPTLFVRDPEDMKRVLPEVHPDCAWVLAGEGIATRKYDGTCVMLEEYEGERQWWARREVKPGKTPPHDFRPIEHDEVTGKTVGWVPIAESSFAKYFDEAVEPLLGFGGLISRSVPAGTYELIGPKINGNPEGAQWHRLQSHANAQQLEFDPSQIGCDVASAFEFLRDMLADLAGDGWEGVVWHHPDGRMAKLKRRDFPARVES